MGKRVGLTTYGLNVRNENCENIELHDINGMSFLDIIERVANQNLNIYDDDIQTEQIFTFDQIIKKKVRNENDQEIYEVLFLRIKTGGYGTESEIVDKDTGVVAYTKSVKDADVLPFGCCVMVPGGQYYGGVITLQSIGRFGIKTVLHKKLDYYIKGIDNNLRISMGTIVPKIYMERFLNNGILQSVRLIRNGIPDDFADRYGVDRGAKDIIEERIIRKPRGFIGHKIDDIRACMSGNKRYDEIIQIDDFEIDDLKLDFKMGYKTKTISMKNLDNLVASEDITENVILENGIPTFESLCKEMEETALFYLKAKGFVM